jgi:hypothetical protein
MLPLLRQLEVIATSTILRLLERINRCARLVVVKVAPMPRLSRLVLVVPVVVVAQEAQLAALVAVAPVAKETLVVTRSVQQPCCFVLVVVAAAKQLQVVQHHLPQVVQVVVDSRFQPDGLTHQHFQRDGQPERKNSLPVVVVVATSQVALVDHQDPVVQVVLGQPAQQPQQHPSLVLVVVVVE